MTQIEVSFDEGTPREVLIGDKGAEMLLQTVINEILQAEVTEHLGAKPGEQTADRNEVERITGTRPCLTDDKTYEERPWKGTRRNHERRNGMLVPTGGEVAWIHPEGAVAYWRGHMESVEYQFVNHDDLNAQRMPDSL